MTSHQEEEAGPSGLARQDQLALLGLDTSDSEKEEEETNLLCPEETARKMTCAMTSSIIWNANMRFKPNYFNKVEGEVWMVRRAPSSLSWTLMWIV